MLTARDESAHAPGAFEAWRFEVVAPNGAWALFVQFGLLPKRDGASWWSVLARTGEPLLFVRDEGLALPRAKSLEVRGDGLWAELTCREPFERWQVNFEGIALALDDPSDVAVSEIGYRTPVEFEFEWEADAPVRLIDDGYSQRCTVHGEVQIASAGNVLALDEPVPGWRAHVWRSSE